jgi:hypothetical protein
LGTCQIEGMRLADLDFAHRLSVADDRSWLA